MEIANDSQLGEGEEGNMMIYYLKLQFLNLRSTLGGINEPLDLLVTSKRFSCFVVSFQAVNFFQKPRVGPTGKENPDRSLWGK